MCTIAYTPIGYMAASYIISRYRRFVNVTCWRRRELGDKVAGFFKSLFRRRGEAANVSSPVIQPATRVAAGTSDAEPVHVTDDSFEKVVLQSPVPAIVDFWAPWCGPCRMVAPIIEDLAQEYDGRALIAKLNTDENLRLTSELGIMGIPTLILYRDGVEVDRVVGFAPRKVLEQKLVALLN